ncbi:MAG TPA: adenylosuccinate lyase [Ktedonobacterales bacterium]|nr:adenylosuccinate lyase [Ktedonobacterales bacterium]
MIERYNTATMQAIWSEEHKLDIWLKIELLVCEGWAREGVISAQDMEKLRQASYNVDRMQAIERESHHDVISFLRSVQEQLGPEGRFLHLGMTSSDVLDTGLAIQIKEAGAVLAAALDHLISATERAALTYKETLMVGRTHGIHAEPMTFGLKLALWVAELRRARQRLSEALEQIAVGAISGAVGTHATIPPTIEEYVCAQLGLSVDPVSSQIIQRDRHAHFLTTLALVASSLEKMAQEIRHLQRTEVSEAFEPFGAEQQGSSAMPHKRNPEKCERICGLARVIRGHALTGMENVALWHERDISHSSAERLIIPDSATLLHYMLDLFADVVEHLDVDAERMRQNLESTRGLIFSQRIMLALIDKGMPRQAAYKLVQRNAQHVWRGKDEQAHFLVLLETDPEIRAHLSPEELRQLTDTSFYTRYIDTAFTRLGLIAPATANDAAKQAPDSTT